MRKVMVKVDKVNSPVDYKRSQEWSEYKDHWATPGYTREFPGCN